MVLLLKYTHNGQEYDPENVNDFWRIYCHSALYSKICSVFNNRNCSETDREICDERFNRLEIIGNMLCFQNFIMNHSDIAVTIIDPIARLNRNRAESVYVRGWHLYHPVAYEALKEYERGARNCRVDACDNLEYLEFSPSWSDPVPWIEYDSDQGIHILNYDVINN